jgi:hypothetical protein
LSFLAAFNKSASNRDIVLRPEQHRGRVPQDNLTFLYRPETAPVLYRVSVDVLLGEVWGRSKGSPVKVFEKGSGYRQVKTCKSQITVNRTIK